ncbi:DnaT-like ssDNA-binding protein [Pseudorhodoplanes sp.]|uniref:DnaT-like ssDNA-binding protein n=1 Tax=Pseudorhodoplanes sp. TaxID=1934341 RepID=UPI002C9392E9|nr:DnaT-like ssDNA-binding protein [Pseudorhodoplanes sp.]HWV44124.1 DnaT-like ssDNA-binding protein [Pseudorhodoplanes sp.]
MALEVEDGTGKSGAESYVSVADAASYCDARGLMFSTGETVAKEAALRRATTAIDALYGSRFPGARLNGRAQALQWPRTDAYDADGEEIASSEIPDEVIKATCEFAVRELAEPGSTMPDLERGGAIRALRAGSVSIEYAGNATARTVYSIVDGILATLLKARDMASFQAEASRG